VSGDYNIRLITRHYRKWHLKFLPFQQCQQKSNGLSSSVLTITDGRNRIGEDTFEAIERQKSWLHTGIIEFGAADELEPSMEESELRDGRLFRSDR